MRIIQHSRGRMAWLAAGLFICSTLAWAQPPALFHYQGRLTTSGGAPITTLQTVFFSLWSGGTATTANSGTQLYGEQASITPDVNGVFEFNIGSGTNTTGTLAPASFNTTQPIYIQVAVGSSSNVLMPRSQMTSVGYSFMAGTAATASYAPTAGTPQVNSVVDTTGGSVVIGDLLQINGAGLTNAVVFIGGKSAPIKTQSATQIICQVPIGIPQGLNPVTVALNNNASALSSVTAANIDVHRLLVHVSPGADPQVTIIDAATRNTVTQINVGYTLGSDSSIPTLQAAFANQGSLLLIPSNQTGNGNVTAIDLTANPPKLISNFNTAAGRPTAVAVSPDNAVMVVSDYTNSTLRTVPLTQFFPPYTSSLFGTSQDFFTDSKNVAFKPAAFGLPRGSTFVGNRMFMATSGKAGELYAFRHNPGTRYFSFYIPPSQFTNVTIVNRASIGTQPFAIRATSDLTRVLVTTLTGVVVGFFTAPEGISPDSFNFSGGNNPLQLAIAPDNQTILIADQNHGSTPNSLHVFNMTGNVVTVAGDTLGPLPTSGPSEDFLLAAVEPVKGDLVAVGTDNSTLYLYQRDGGILTGLGTLTTSPYTGRWTYELKFQP